MDIEFAEKPTPLYTYVCYHDVCYHGNTQDKPYVAANAELYFVEPKPEGCQGESTSAQDIDCVAELYYEHKQEPDECQSSTAATDNSEITNPDVVPSESSGASCDNSYHGNEDITMDNKLFRCEHCSFTTVHRQSISRQKLLQYYTLKITLSHVLHVITDVEWNIIWNGTW